MEFCDSSEKENLGSKLNQEELRELKFFRLDGISTKEIQL